MSSAFLVILFLFAIGVAVSQPAPRSASESDVAIPSGRQFRPPYYVPNPDVAPDYIFQQAGAIGPDPFLHDFAWNTFIALNWPASSRFNGVPNRQNLVGGTVGGGEGLGNKGMPSGPTVWETFKDTNDIYLNPPVRPTGFNADESIPAACQQLALQHPGAAQRTMVMNAKISNVLRDVRQAFSDAPLIDLNGNLVRYEVKVNETYYDFVVENEYYDSHNQPSGGINFPEGASDANGVGAIRVKAAWKQMAGAGSKFPDDPNLFYTTDALIYDESTGKCAKQTMGLVGLHIVQKTARFPRYVWSTFEHVNNAPTDEQVESGAAKSQQWNFYDPASTAKWNVKPADDPAKWTTPVQVVRIMEVTPNAVIANPKYQQILGAIWPNQPGKKGNVWANYMLVGVQWGGPEMSPDPIQPKFMANTTMETYLQDPVDDPDSPHGCINCHNKYAPFTDGDFQLHKAYPEAPQNDDEIAAKSRAIAATKR